MRILFVCKYNRFRSKIAEAFFKKINKNKKISAGSAGIFKGIPVAKNVVVIARKLGMRLNKKTNSIEESLLGKIGLLIIVANNVPASLFKFRVQKIITWKIPDCSQNDKKAVEKITKQIIKKVESLNRMLEKEKWKQKL